MLVSLARTVLKYAVPGVPDIYQGTELWDLSLVDPDNRRPVDYGLRSRMLDNQEDPKALLSAWRDGRIKQKLARSLLADRAAAPVLYANGDYQPLKGRGSRARNVLAFVRTCGSERLAVIVPRLFAGFVKDEQPPPRSEWGDTKVPLPPGRWRDIVTGREVTIEEDGKLVSELFTELPLSVLRAQA
jgi:(1->4)-alpha-D-glucan 1-alpha-D-glucosylmutase